VLLHLTKRRQFFGDRMEHEIVGNQACDHVRSDPLVRPLGPSNENLPAILLHQSQDRRSLDTEHSGELLEESLVNIPSFLKADDLVGRSDEVFVTQDCGDLTWAQIQAEPLLSKVAGKIGRHEEEKTVARAGTWESLDIFLLAGIRY
jgi:hypothetical protein